ncbi:MAG: 60S ribosomal export protein NMD3 [Methanoregula sp.]|jgi:nonsense-mediated mRNA decay protein 3|nr:60S ribosomal export protein NMD3 [Methanoregula sp.]
MEEPQGQKNIQGRFCPRCGKPSENDGLCNQCRVKNTEWITCDRRVTHIHCPSCGAVKQVNTWTDSSRERAELAPELARSAVHLHPDVKRSSIAVSIRDISTNRSRAMLTVKGTLYTLPVEKECTVELAWHKEQCDRCNRITGSYYEGLVQVRAEDRLPSPYEIQTAGTIASQLEDSLQAGGERLSYISDITETKDGLDITVGSQHIGLLIVQGITNQLGGRYTTHPKLVGEKNGRQLFRITYLVRLPYYQRHDVVLLGKTYAEVEQVEPRRVRLFDLSEGRSRTVNTDQVSRRIGNARLAEQALVAYVTGDMVGILDPVTCATTECRKLPWLETTAGEYVHILRDGDRIVLVR